MVTKYSGVCTSQVNPNNKNQHENWKNPQNAVGHVGTTYATSYYSYTSTPTKYEEVTKYDSKGKATKKKVATKFKDTYKKPWTLAFHDFNMNLPDGACIKKISFAVRMRVADSNAKVLKPIGKFRIPTDAYKEKFDNTDTKGYTTGWNDGMYMVVPKGTYLSTSYDTYYYNISGDDLDIASYTKNKINQSLMGIDILWQDAEWKKKPADGKSITSEVRVEWVSCTIDYELANYQISVTSSTKSKNKDYSEFTEINVISTNNPFVKVGTEAYPLVVDNGDTLKLKWTVTNKSCSAGTENVIVKFNIPDDTFVSATTNYGTYHPENGTWWFQNFNKSSKNRVCDMTLKGVRNGLNTVTATYGNSTQTYYFWVNKKSPTSGGTSGVTHLTITPNQSEYYKHERSCINIQLEGQANTGVVTVQLDQSDDWIVRDENPFRVIDELCSDNLAYFNLVDPYTLQIYVPTGEDYAVSMDYCVYPNVVGTMPITVNEVNTSTSKTYNMSVGDVRDIILSFDEGTHYSINNHRMYSEIETDTSIIDCISDEIDANMVMTDCAINMSIWEDLDYIGCIPLEHLHFDPKSTYKDTLLDSHYKNKRYMGKKLATDEDITLNVRLHPQQVTTLQGLIDMDKPIPINANHKCFEGDALNHRGWAEIYAVKTELTNPHWYKCDIDVKYLTHNLKTRFKVDRGSNVDDLTIPPVLSEIYHSGENLSTTELDKFFNVDTDGMFMYMEDYDDVVIDDTERNIFSIDNGEHIRIKTNNPISHTSSFSFNWMSTILEEYKENHIERIVSIVDMVGNCLFKYQYTNVVVSDSEVTADVIYSVGDEEYGNDKITFRYDVADDDDTIDDEEIEDIVVNGTDRYGTTLTFTLNNNKLTVIDEGFNGKEITIDDIELSDTEYYYVVEWTNRNDDGETNAIESYFDFVVQDTLLSSNYVDKFGKIVVSPFPVVDKKLLFTREGEEGTIYYYVDDGEEFSYIVEPYYQYMNGTDLVTDSGISIFNLNYGYEIVYIQNGLVRLGFNRVDNMGHMYLGKYDPKSGRYITTNILHLGKYTDLNLNSISDDKIEVQASDSTFTIYRGHPYIKINHANEDIFIDTTFTSAWGEKVGTGTGSDLPVYWDLLNDDNLLPPSIGGQGTINPNDIIVEEVEEEDNNNTNLSWNSTPENAYIGQDITFTVSDQYYDYKDEVFLDGEWCSFGSYEWSVESDGIPRELTIAPVKDTIQVDEVDKVYATLTDGTNGISGQTIYFYEVFEPTTLALTGSASIIQSGETITLTAKLKDEDGSGIEGETVYFYERIE